jgi:ribosome-associated protein YbcJ (S4-like RNA binding protein)
MELEKKDHLVSVFVNDQTLKLLGHMETGHEIKTAAIEQSVPIHSNFVLEEELAHGKHKIIGDEDKVQLRDQMRFIAREPVVVVTVNEQPVKLHGHSATGAEIKAAAIAQGVHIQQNFVLQEELPNGTSRIIGDGDKVHLREHLRFTAIAPDDNS